MLLVVADFGMDAEEEQYMPGAWRLHYPDTEVYGTFEYMSPECYKRDYGVPCFASDVFSFGIILWELWARERVYMGFNRPRVHVANPCQRVLALLYVYFLKFHRAEN